MSKWIFRVMSPMSLAILLSLGFCSSLWAHGVLKMATTTSTENSGLLNYLLPIFEKKYDIKIQVISVGTGKALKLGENGDVDVVLVHSRPDEDKFIAEGHGIDRRDVMYNDFILVGPIADPAKVRGMTDIIAAFRKVESTHVRFVSRGDDSGTDKMEKRYWKMSGVMPTGNAYISAGQGMGEVLTMAASLGAYTLSDRSTYSAYKSKLDLVLLVSGEPKLFNPYGIIAVNPKKYPTTNYRDTTTLINWLTSDEGQKAIASFKINGEQQFFPNAKSSPGQQVK